MARILMIAYTTYLKDGRVKRHAQALADRGDYVDLICLDNPQQGVHNGVNVIGLKLRRYRGPSKTNYLRTYLHFFASATFKACRLGFKQPYDVVIVCTMPDAAVLCAFPLKLLGSKLVLDIHDTMPELYRDKFGGPRGALGARLLRLEERASTWLANRVLAVHDLHRRRLVQAGVRSDKISVVLNAPDPKLFRGDRSRSGSPRLGKFMIVCHGTIARRLGLDVAIKAIAILRGRSCEVDLLTVGSGDHLKEFKALAARLKLEDRVHFHASVPLEYLPEVLCQASLGLVPNYASSATHLMLPVKLLEYAALAIPIVAARLQTIQFYFDDSSVEFFEPGNAADLARAIEKLYRDPIRRRELAINALRRMKLISWEQQRERYYAAIDSLIGSNGRTGFAPNTSRLDPGVTKSPGAGPHQEYPRSSVID